VTARSLGILVVLLVSVISPLAEAVTVAPKEDDKAVLHNPDMGWVLYENYPLDPNPGGSSTLLALPNETFAPVDTVAIMFSWQDVEKREGAYDFSKADFAYDYWAKRGKKIQLRLSTASLLWWSRANPPAGKGVPDYVLAKMPPETKQVRTESGFSYDVVDAREPYYRQRLEKFLIAVAAHFSKDRPVTLIDLRGFGLWGEWHSGYRYASLNDRHQALSSVIDLWAKCFPNHFLALSYSYDPDSPADFHAGPTNRLDPAFTQTYDAFLHYSAFDHALKVPSVTFRRDGAGGAVHSNERKLIEQAYATANKGPMFCEFVDGYAQSKKGKPGWVEWKINDALSLHPNYVNLLGWQGADARDFMKERPDLIETGLRTMGYRLLPTQIQYPPTVRAGQQFQLDSTWTNQAVGRAIANYHLALTLTDATGKPLATTDTGATGCDQFLAGKTYPLTSKATFIKTPPGQYLLRLSLIDPRTKNPIALPLKDSDNRTTYPIGPITITP